LFAVILRGAAMPAIEFARRVSGVLLCL